MDPEPRPDWEMSELERRLIEAARRDRVPHDLGARIADGLGVQMTASAAIGSGTAPGASAVGAPLFAKAALWGVLSVALVVAVASWHEANSAEGARIADQQPRARARSPVAQPVVAATVTDTAGAVEPPAQAAPARAAEGAAALPTARSVAPDDAALHAEIALLDHARNALRGGENARALRLLEQHERRFARARLAPEAAALRIEALVQRGSHEQAGSMARQFVSAYPSHPLSAQVSKLAATPAARARLRAP
jgi:hypothetical protein